MGDRKSVTSGPLRYLFGPTKTATMHIFNQLLKSFCALVSPTEEKMLAREIQVSKK